MNVVQTVIYVLSKDCNITTQKLKLVSPNERSIFVNHGRSHIKTSKHTMARWLSGTGTLICTGHCNIHPSSH